MKNKYL